MLCELISEERQLGIGNPLISEELSLAVQRAGFSSGIYYVDFKYPNKLLFDQIGKFKVNNIRKRSNLLFSDNNVERVNYHYIERFVAEDKNYIKSLQQHCYCWNNTVQNVDYKNILNENGYINKVSCSFNINGSPDYVGRFLLFSGCHNDALTNFNSVGWLQIRNELMQFHAICCVALKKSLNPYVGMNIVKDKQLELLELLAQGLSRLQISQQLFMSARGVDYHVERLKLILDVVSPQHLIAKSFRLGLIS